MSEKDKKLLVTLSNYEKTIENNEEDGVK